MAANNKEVLFGLYNDEEVLMKAIDMANAAHLDIMDVFTPFPVHGLDEKLYLGESRLHIAGFVYGLIGTLTSFLFMTWVFTRDWPMIFGGKPYWSIPALIPVIFELTVLFAAIGMTVSFYTVCGLAPGVTNPILHDRITDDKFCLAFNKGTSSDEEVEAMLSFFEETGAEEVQTKSI